MTAQNGGLSGLFPGIIHTYPNLVNLRHPQIEPLVSATYQFNRMVKGVLDILKERPLSNLPPQTITDLLLRSRDALAQLQHFSATPGVNAFIDAETQLLVELEAQWHITERLWWPRPDTTGDVS